jgi:hypothetical protein
MADFLGKKYKLESSENFDEYMKAIGNVLCIVFLIKLKFDQLNLLLDI